MDTYVLPPAPGPIVAPRPGLRRELGWVRPALPPDDYAGDRGLWGQGGSIVHELSHAYHDCYLRDGHGNKFIGRRYDRAVHAERSTTP